MIAAAEFRRQLSESAARTGSDASNNRKQMCESTSKNNLCKRRFLTCLLEVSVTMAGTFQVRGG
jgi:hypothetical protein